jgi:sulfatase maturation enzyme AslB (radical SAM superfamily)
LCDGLYAFFTHTQPAMSEMAELLRSGRDAHEIMAMFET